MYSLLDGASRIDELIAEVKRLGMTAVAITDHGQMYGAMHFYKAAKKAGIKPIIGCEAYLAPRSRKEMFEVDGVRYYHLILLAENETGYRNLVKLVSLGNIEGTYYKPRIDKELLRQYHEGIICLSACIAGEIPRALIQDNPARAEALVKEYIDIFGKDNFFIELQKHGIPEEDKATKGLVRLAEKYGVGLVLTNDSHYTHKEDAAFHDVLLCIQTNKTLDDPGRMRFQNDEFYLKSPEEMARLFPDLPEAFDGYRIAHLSDLHVSSAARAARTAGIVERTNALGADLVVITGDFVDGAPSSRREDVAPLGGLVARDGVFGCTGNHEYYSDYGAWRSEFRRIGVRMLENAAATIRRGEDGAALALLGVNDLVGGPDPDAAAAAAPQGAFRILLAHRPIRLARHAALGVRLQLSGHTHGGAILGLDRFVARANEGHVRGLYREHGLTLYVNAGTGQWAGFPERVGVPPEIACLTLRRGAGSDGVRRAGFTASGRM